MDPLILLVEPELDERAATATMTRAKRVYEEGARDISRVMRQQMTEGTAAAGKGFDDLETKARRAYLSMQDASEKVAREERKLDAAREKGAANAESLARKVERARLDEIQAIEKATAAYKEYGQAAENAGQSGERAGAGILGGLRGAVSGAGQTGGDMANEFAAGFASSSALMRLGASTGPIGLAVAGVVAIGTMAGKVLADNIAAGMDTLRMQDQFRAKIGLDEATMRTFGSAASKAWTSGFGQSIQDNLTSLQFGVQSGLINRNASDADLAQFASQMDTVKQLVDADSREIAAGTRNFVKTGLVDNYQQAFDLIVAAQQKGLNISNDLLDTAEEYGTTLHAVGLSGQEAFGLIAQMQAGGVRNTDVAADALKELSINVADGSKSTKQAFEAMGLNADILTQKFAEGGPAAREAFGEVLTGLRSLSDPVQQQLVGLALYKTKWEDAKVAIQAANLDTAASTMGNLQGKTQDATTALNAHTDQWDLLGRNIDNTMSKLQTWLADTSIGKFASQGLPGFFNTNLFGDAGTAAQAKLDAAKAALDAQNALGTGFANAGDAQRQHRGTASGTPDGDRVPVVPMVPGADQSSGSTSLPPAPVLPLQYTNTAGLPSAIANATTRLDDARHEVAEKEARVNQLVQSNIAKADDIQKARNDLTKAEQNQQQAEQALTDARVSAAKQAQKQYDKLSSDLDTFGNKLDADFGISKGLGGIVENFVKAAGNILAAPFLQALGLIAKANPNEGSGLIGIAAANGAFGSQYTPAAIAATQNVGTYSYGAQPGGGYPSIAASALPGESAKDFAHRVMMPFWQSQGFQVGDHQADQYGEHQNGAVDIMVPDLATGQKVLQQVLSDPNVYGAIFNNQTYGYGHGLTPQDYTAGHTGNPTQDHQDHVHAWYKPGGQDNISPLTGGAASSGPVPVTVVSAPGMPSQGLSPDQWNAIAGAEASGNWSANTGNGFSGGLQFAPSTWTGFGGGQYAPEAWQATPQQQMAIGDRVLAAQGPGAWPATSAAHPEWFQPQPYSSGWGPGPLAPPSPGTVPTGGGPMAPGMPQGLGIYGGGPGIGGAAAASSPTMGGGLAYPSQGGNSGNILGGLPLDGVMAATSALDMMAPGSSAAAKIGIQLANRTIGYAAQNAGIAASGLMETFSIGDNPRGSIGNSWLGKLAGGLAGAAPALPNLAGGKKPPGPMEQATGGQQQGGNVDNSQVNNITLQPPKDTSANTQAAMVAEQTRMYAPAGRQ
ncbi:Gp16 [Mycolicibacterium canariasense]|uniref:Gp16 n=1 Tax=Mycolicibacterium canariasense TaxID=228230 RepID=A0A100WBK0_MYCCR|nr:transglycosylase family protein [Mycolicibacterium canariasense]ORV02497.1 hypothetical protein AWB94_00730 [Mycolicibacterium canariasense]GAS95459.1 Gp16 [Mycolicibacterium canariasense]